MNLHSARSNMLSFAALLLLTFASVDATAAGFFLKSVANPNSAAPGDRVRYAVTVSNSNTATASVSLTAVVPTGTTVADNELSLGARCDGVAPFTTCQAGQTLSFSFNVPAGGEETIVYPALVNTSTPPPNGTKMSSLATATIGTTVLKATATATVKSSAAALMHLTLSALPAQALANGMLTYTLTYGNPSGNAVAANLLFPVPSGTTFVSASGGGTEVSGEVSWSLGTVAAHSAARQTVVVQVGKSRAAGTLLSASA